MTRFEWVLAATVGVLCGLGVFTFGYARGGSYLTDNPEACANCHVMQETYSSWLKSSHHHAAVCNDCHTPAGVVPKYWTKALNGFFHSMAFTTGRFEDQLQITARNRDIAKQSCFKCHAQVAHGIQESCLKCHGEVGH